MPTSFCSKIETASLSHYLSIFSQPTRPDTSYVFSNDPSLHRLSKRPKNFFTCFSTFEVPLITQAPCLRSRTGPTPVRVSDPHSNPDLITNNTILMVTSKDSFLSSYQSHVRIIIGTSSSPSFTSVLQILFDSVTGLFLYFHGPFRHRPVVLSLSI